MARSRRHTLLLVLLVLGLLLAVGLGLRACGRLAGERNSNENADTVAKGAPSLGIPSEGDLTRAPEPGSRVAASAPREDGPRLNALTFVMDRGGLRLATTVTAPGRAKAPPTSVAAHQLEFTLQDAGGQVVYQGALDHPLRRVEEYEDPARPGELKRLPRELESEAFQLRYPSGLGARTVTFVERVTIDGQIKRTPLGTFSIP